MLRKISGVVEVRQVLFSHSPPLLGCMGVGGWASSTAIKEQLLHLHFESLKCYTLRVTLLLSVNFDIECAVTCINNDTLFTENACSEIVKIEHF